MGKQERLIEELYRDDPERADALVFGRSDRRVATRISRRRRPGRHERGGRRADRVRRDHAGRADPGGARAGGQEGCAGRDARAEGPRKLLHFPGKDGNLVVLGDKPLVAETPEQLLDDDTTPTSKFFIRNNGQIPEPDRSRTPGSSPSTARSTSRSSSRSASSRSASAQDLPHGARVRRQRPLVLHAAGARQPVDQRRRRLRRVDRRAARRRAAGRRRQGVGRLHGQLRRRPASVGRRPSSAAVARRAAQEGDGAAQPARLGDERQAAGERSTAARCAWSSPAGRARPRTSG